VDGGTLHVGVQAEVPLVGTRSPARTRRWPLMRLRLGLDMTGTP
jgi:hypothetical protein